jgi:hypothetical protein
MAVQANTQTSFKNTQKAEEVENFINQLSPTDTPLWSMLKKTKVESTMPQWTTDVINADGENAMIDGAESVNKTIIAPKRYFNFVQRMEEVFTVTGTDKAQKAYGYKDHVAYLATQSAETLKHKQDRAIAGCANGANGARSNVGDEAHHAGTDEVSPRRLRAIEGFIDTNVSLGAGGAAPDVSSLGNWDAGTAGTARTLTPAQLEAELLDVAEGIKSNGGMLDVLIAGWKQRAAINGIDAGITKFENTQAEKLTGTFKLWITPFGNWTIVGSTNVRNDAILALETKSIEIGVLRPYEKMTLAVNGDYEKRGITTEFTVKVKAPSHQGVVGDLI